IAALSSAGGPLDPGRVPDALLEPLVAAAVAVRELLGVCPVEPMDPRIERRRRVRAALALGDPLLRLEGTKSWADVALTDLLLAPPSGVGAARPRVPGAAQAGAARRRHLHAAADAARARAVLDRQGVDRPSRAPRARDRDDRRARGGRARYCRAQRGRRASAGVDRPADEQP